MGLVAGAMLLTACSSGGGDASLPSERPAGALTGHAVDAVVVGGTVTVYGFLGGQRGDALSTGATDQEGRYSVTIRAEDQPVLIELAGGSYVEEASGKSITLRDGQVLRAVTFYRSGTPLTTMVTPWTNLAAGLVAYKVRQGLSVENAVTEASTAISSLGGVDILRTYPRNITDPANATTSLTDEHLYGFLTAAISSWTAWASEQNGQPPHEIWSSIALAQVMYQDIVADGMLDGRGFNKSETGLTDLGFGLVRLSANTYRADFAKHLLGMAAGDANKTGITVQTLLPRAEHLAATTHEVFGTTAPVPLDNEGPTITPVEPERRYHNASFTFAVGVSDFVGVKSVTFDIDGTDLGPAANPRRPAIPINTKTYADGLHQIGVRAVDYVGNESYRRLEIYFMNTAPFVWLEAPTITNQRDVVATGTYTDNGAGVAAISIRGISARIEADGTWSASIGLQDGQNSIPIVITDQLGNIRQQVDSIIVDRVPPTISAQYSDAEFSIGSGQHYTGNLADALALHAPPLHIETSRADLNGVPADNAASLQINGIPYFGFIASDPSVNAVFTQKPDLVVQMQYSLGGTVRASWHSLATQVPGDYLIPFVTELLHPDWLTATPEDQHTIEVRVRDLAGNETTFSFTFRVDFVVPTMAAVVVTDLPAFSAPFANRATLHNAPIATTQYRYTNSTPHAHLVQLADNSAHSITAVVEQAIREHVARLRTTSEWRAQFVVALRHDPFDLNTPFRLIPISAAPWESITSIGSRTGTSTVTDTVPAPSYGPVISLGSDTLPTVSPTNWEGFHPHADWTNFTYNYGKPGAGYIVGYYAYVSSTLGLTINGNFLEQRRLFAYASEPGFPRNNYSTFTNNFGFATSGFTVVDASGRPIAPILGWYRIPAGTTVTITKTVVTPAITVYNDADVGDPGTFSSYSLRQYDKSLAWSISRFLRITRAHDAGIPVVSRMTQLDTVSDTGTASYMLAR
jgi:hypothetical protein